MQVVLSLIGFGCKQSATGKFRSQSHVPTTDSRLAWRVA